MTPVSIYQKIRDKFSNSILLESSDYGANDNSYAYVCFDPISTFKVKNNQISQKFPDNTTQIKKIDKTNNVVSELNLFSQKFKTSKSDSKVSALMSFPISTLHLKKIPSASRISRRLSIIFFSILKSGIP